MKLFQANLGTELRMGALVGAFVGIVVGMLVLDRAPDAQRPGIPWIPMIASFGLTFLPVSLLSVFAHLPLR